MGNTNMHEIYVAHSYTSSLWNFPKKERAKKSITSLYVRLHLRKWYGRLTIIFPIYHLNYLLPVIIHSLENSFSLFFTRESTTRHHLYLQPSLYIISILCLLNYPFPLFNHPDHQYTSRNSTCNSDTRTLGHSDFQIFFWKFFEKKF